jgi:hypothetical protein
MKKKFLFFGLATVMMAACSSEDSLTTDGNLDVNAEGSRYMAISLVANEQSTRGTRADEEVDQTGFGLAAEYAIYGKENILFYFFDSEGNAYSVDDDDDGNNCMTPTSIGELTKDSDGKESVDDSKDLNFTTDDGNITSVSNLILAFQKQTTATTPAQVVVLVNAPSTYMKKYDTLDALRAEFSNDESGQNMLESGSTTKYFLMSNSVYQNSATGQIVDATPITSDNIKTSAVEAAKSPVKIHVERVDAKVTLKEEEYYHVDNANLAANQNTTTIVSADDAVYVKILGWTLYNKIKGYNLIKSLTAETSPWWNDEDNFRSYWANMPKSGTELVNTSLSYNDVKGSTENNNGHIEYALENTNTSDNTGVILAAQLYQKTSSNGTDTYSKLEVAKFLSKYYTLDGLKTAVAQYLGNSLWSATTTTTDDGASTTNRSTITADDIEFAASTDVSYAATVTLSEAGKKKTWYASKDATTSLNQTSTESNEGTTTVESIFKKVPRIQIWRDGYCYYFAPIKHTIGTTTKDAIVRNHWYEVSVNSISGLGTPVLDPSVETTLTNPGTNDDQEWYLDAQIKILSWKKLSSSIDFGATTDDSNK